MIANLSHDTVELQHLELRLPLAVPEGVEPAKAEELIPVFHHWVEQQWGETLLIDVADYRHVPDGPGVLLVGHEADFAVAMAGAQAGLRYVRKDTVPGGNADRLRGALRVLLSAALRLEAEPGLAGRLAFARQELEVTVNDRLLAPNRPETFQALRPELEAFFGGLLGEGTRVAYRPGDPRARFTVFIAAGRPFSPEALLEALGEA